MYFTPGDVASYVVRSADALARETYGIGLGGCRVIDPALGDGVFASEVLAAAPEARVLAFELLPEVAAQAAGRLPPSVRIVEGSALTGFPDIEPGAVPVILGNPPWRGHTANPGTIRELLADYYPHDGRPERNTKWLQDDYIRFFRWAQEVVEQSGRGIVGFVTNHAWLRGPTHRAMRACLRRTFDDIRVLDLHGSHLRRETAPDGQADENVFPVRPGCAVALLVRTGRPMATRIPGRGEGTMPRVGHFDLWGPKAEKLTWLASHDATSTPWNWLPADAPVNTLRAETRDPEYDSWPSLTDLFGVWSIGMVSGRDAESYFPTREALQAAHPEIPAAEAFQALYRIDDRRWTAFALHTRPRRKVMAHLREPGATALVAMRQGGPAVRLRHLVAGCPIDNCVLSTESTARAYAFPLRLAGGSSNLDARRLGFDDPESAFEHIVRTLADSAYQARFRAELLRDFPRIPLAGGQTRKPGVDNQALNNLLAPGSAGVPPAP